MEDKHWYNKECHQVTRAVTCNIVAPAQNSSRWRPNPICSFFKHCQTFLLIEMALGALLKFPRSHHFIMLFLDYTIRYVKSIYKGYMKKGIANEPLQIFLDMDTEGNRSRQQCVYFNNETPFCE